MFVSKPRVNCLVNVHVSLMMCSSQFERLSLFDGEILICYVEGACPCGSECMSLPPLTGDDTSCIIVIVSFFAGREAAP